MLLSEEAISAFVPKKKSRDKDNQNEDDALAKVASQIASESCILCLGNVTFWKLPRQILQPF